MIDDPVLVLPAHARVPAEEHVPELPRILGPDRDPFLGLLGIQHALSGQFLVGAELDPGQGPVLAHVIVIDLVRPEQEHARGRAQALGLGHVLARVCGRGHDREHAAHDLRSGSPEVWQYMPNLYLVPASALGNKAQRTTILSSPEFAGLIADLREAFDYVIIDVPAISEAADAKLVLRHADAGILLVRAQQTTTGVVSTALDRLGRNTVSGAVLNVFS